MAAGAAFSITSGPEAKLLRQRATAAAVAVAVTLIIVKLVAWLETGSVALLSSVLDSLGDGFASLINLLAVRHAMAPADREHRFGHGKAEPLAVLAQSAFITGSALLVLAEAARRLVQPAPVVNSLVGITVMVFSIVISLALVAYQRYAMRRTGSIAISADELHYRGDLLLSGGILAALLLSSLFDLRILDPLFGGAVGIWIIWSASRLARLALTQLMDQELPDREREKIREIALSHPDVSATHDLRTRVAGPTAFIQIHIEMDGAMSLTRAHEISDEVEAKLRAAYPNADVIIHQDPKGIGEPHMIFPEPVLQ
jgi:ferrous-iron efflux pump FieF